MIPLNNIFKVRSLNSFLEALQLRLLVANDIFKFTNWLPVLGRKLFLDIGSMSACVSKRERDKERKEFKFTKWLPIARTS